MPIAEVWQINLFSFIHLNVYSNRHHHIRHQISKATMDQFQQNDIEVMSYYQIDKYRIKCRHNNTFYHNNKYKCCNNSKRTKITWIHSNKLCLRKSCSFSIYSIPYIIHMTKNPIVSIKYCKTCARWVVFF